MAWSEPAGRVRSLSLSQGGGRRRGVRAPLLVGERDRERSDWVRRVEGRAVPARVAVWFFAVPSFLRLQRLKPAPGWLNQGRRTPTNSKPWTAWKTQAQHALSHARHQEPATPSDTLVPSTWAHAPRAEKKNSTQRTTAIRSSRQAPRRALRARTSRWARTSTWRTERGRSSREVGGRRARAAADRVRRGGAAGRGAGVGGASPSDDDGGGGCSGRLRPPRGRGVDRGSVAETDDCGMAGGVTPRLRRKRASMDW